MTNIVKTNNQQLRLAPLSVGLLSTLRIALPMVPQSATNVEVIVTSGDTHNAYTATFDSTNRWWLCDIDASQFPTVGRQKYEVAYKISGDQFWDGQGWIEIVKATTSGITPTPAPDPSRYVVVTINGYGAQNPDGAVRIPRLFISQTDPSTTTGYIEGDQYFNRTSGEQWVLCSVTGALAWVKCAGGGVVSVNGKAGVVVLAAHDVDAYTQSETDDKITRFVAHYLTDKVGGRFVPFATHAALADAKAHHSEANPRFFYAGQGFTPTKNDYCVILADETQGGKTTRYSYVGEWPSGSWQYQYTINDTAFSEAQWAAINSGVTEEWMSSTLSAATTALNNAEAAQSTADQALAGAGEAATDAELARNAAGDAAAAAGSADEKAEEALAKCQDLEDEKLGRMEPADDSWKLGGKTPTEITEAYSGTAATSVTNIVSGSVVDITQASGAVNLTFADAVGNALRYCELIVRGVTADGGVTINLPSGMDALYAEGVASKAGINHYIFAEYSRGHWLVSRMTRTTTIG